MDISKHPILKDIHDVTGMVEELGASTQLTDIVVKLGEIGEQTERLVNLLHDTSPMTGGTHRCTNCTEVYAREFCICPQCGTPQ